MIRLNRLLPFLVLPLFLTACAGSEFVGDYKPERNQILETCWKQKIKEKDIKKEVEEPKNKDALIKRNPSQKSLQGVVKSKLKNFFQCFLGPESLPSEGSDEEKDILLLRHHIALTMISEYAAYKFDGKVRGKQVIKNTYYDARGKQAQKVLGAIQQTEFLLRTATSEKTPVSKPKSSVELTQYPHRPSFTKVLDHIDYLDRLSSTATIVKQAVKPTWFSILGTVTKISTLVNNVTSANISSTLAGIKDIVISFSVVSNLYQANLDDIYFYTSCASHKARKAIGDPRKNICKADIKLSWEEWDPNLTSACERIAKVIEDDVGLEIDKAGLCVPLP